MALTWETIVRVGKGHYPDLIGKGLPPTVSWGPLTGFLSGGGRYPKTKYFFVGPGDEKGTHGLREGAGYYRYSPQTGYFKEHDAPSGMDERRGLWINGTFIADKEGIRRRRNRVGSAKGKAKGRLR